MYCRKCGKQIDYDSEYCNECKNDQLFFDGKSVLTEEKQENADISVKEMDVSEKASLDQKMAKEKADNDEKRLVSRKFKTSIIALSLSHVAFIFSYDALMRVGIYFSGGSGHVENVTVGLVFAFIALGLAIAGLVLGIKAIKNFRTLLRKVSKAKGIISLIFGIISVSLCAIAMLFILFALEFFVLLL